MKRLGICIAGINGAVGSTLVAGLALLRKRLAEPTGLISEPYVKPLALAPLRNIICGGWDPRGESVYHAALRHGVIEPHQLEPVRKELQTIRPLRSLSVDAFRRKHKLDTVVVLNLLPTGAHKASRQYAALAVQSRCPFINFTPNDCGESKLAGIPYCGRDGKTGQTWLKSVLAPALRDRALQVTGWYSTNLLGNEDGKIVGDPVRGAAKIRDKSKLLPEMLGYEPHHQVQINFYPPRGDNKESWDNIDFTGLLGLPMQLKVNALWRDSILAAAFCIDLARFMELAARRGATGPQKWLGYYFKSPYGSRVHDFHRQHAELMEYLNGGRGSSRAEHLPAPTPTRLSRSRALQRKK